MKLLAVERIEQAKREEQPTPTHRPTRRQLQPIDESGSNPTAVNDHPVPETCFLLMQGTDKDRITSRAVGLDDGILSTLNSMGSKSWSWWERIKTEEGNHMGWSNDFEKCTPA